MTAAASPPAAHSQLQALVAARVLREVAPGEYAFAHALTQAAVYSTLLHRERRQTHHAVADTLLGLYGDTPQFPRQLGDLAYHCEQAEDWEKTLAYARAAGDEALNWYAPYEAITQFTRALYAAGRLGHLPDAEIFRSRAAAYETIGDFDRARDDYASAVGAARAAGDDQAEWHALLDLGLLWTGRDYARAGELYEQALALARRMGDRAALAHSLNRLGNYRLNQGDPGEALRRHREALGIFTELNDLSGQAHSYDLLGMTNYLSGDLVAGTRFYQRAVALFRALDNRRLQVSILGTMSMRCLSAFTDTVTPAARVREAAQDAQAALELARSIQLRSGEAYALFFLGAALAALGELGPALAHARQALAVAESIQHTQWQTASHCVLGVVHTELLDYAAARRHWEQAQQLAREINSAYWINNAAAGLARVCARLRPPDLPGAQAALDSAPLAADAAFLTLSHRSVMAARAAAALAAQDGALALALVDELLATTSYLGSRGAVAIPRLARLRADALRLLGQPQAALDLLEGAAPEAERQGSPPEQMRVLLSLARAAHALGQPARAQAALVQVSALAEQMALTIPDPALRRAFEREAEARIVAAVQ